MPQMIFVNLPVTDLARSQAFYEAVGAVNNPAFTDETAACMVVAEGSIHVMLLTHEKWATFTSKAIPDAHTHAQVLLCVSADRRRLVIRRLVPLVLRRDVERRAGVHRGGLAVGADA